MSVKVYVDPRCDRVYSSYYIKGLGDVFGRRSVRYSLKYFKGVDMSRRIPSDDPAGGEDPRILLFAVKDGQETKKVAVDPRDKIHIYDDAYNWCDVYAKINYEKDKTDDRYKAKILAIAPSFGIPYKGYVSTVCDAIHSTVMCYLPKKLVFKPAYRFIRECVSTRFGRMDIGSYSTKGVPVKPKYIFFISSFWEKRNNDGYDYFIDKVNNERLDYIDAVSTLNGVEFEGGIHSPNNDILNSNGDKVSYTEYFPFKDYVNKAKQSICVFNAPAVWGCQGWKLGEYLAMGKAIISMPLKNELPEPLVDGEDVLFVHGKEEMKAAISKIANDDTFRGKLENGATEYYKKYVSPTAVINYIIGKS